MFDKNILLKKRFQIISNYVVSILNSVNYYQLPYWSGVYLKFQFTIKSKSIILSYISFFKYFFNKVPNIKILNKKTKKVKYPSELILEFKGRSCIDFFFMVLFAYQMEGLDELEKKLLPMYGNSKCFLILPSFFLLENITKVLLLYKNEGLLFEEVVKLYVFIQFRSKINIWNWYFFKFLLQTCDENDVFIEF